MVIYHEKKKKVRRLVTIEVAAWQLCQASCLCAVCHSHDVSESGICCNCKEEGIDLNLFHPAGSGRSPVSTKEENSDD